jgi:FAD binding domain/Berberine and berberine like
MNDTISLSSAAIENLRISLRGMLIQPCDERYEVSRRVFNGMIDKRPALIVRCRGVGDVIACVDFARSNDVAVAVRGGGHSVAGNSVCDGGLVIDLSEMRSIRVDPVRRIARAEGGATWADLDHETQVFGLATTGGTFATTGIAGLTLGGGLGYLNRKYGLTCDNLLSADVVTADGTLVIASDGEHDDLFWALRGGGGNFGVVTSFEYRVHPVGPVLAGLLVYPIDTAKEVFRFHREFARDAPDELRADAYLATTPDGPAAIVVVCYCGSLEVGERVVRPLRSFGAPILDTIAAVPYKTIQTLFETLLPEATIPGNLRYYWKNGFVKELSDFSIDTFVDQFLCVPSRFSVAGLEHLGGAVAAVGERDTAFSSRQSGFGFSVFGQWLDAADTDGNVEWTRNIWAEMQPFIDGPGYINYLTGDEGEAKVRAAYGANYERLSRTKRQYDPGNFFRLNQNIWPAP